MGTFNLFEAILWFAMSLILLMKALYQQDSVDAQKKIFIAMSISFVLFGISDFIEIHTGSWWRPLWLFLMKVAAFVSIAVCTALLFAYEKKSGVDIEEVKQRVAQRESSVPDIPLQEPAPPSDEEKSIDF